MLSGLLRAARRRRRNVCSGAVAASLAQVSIAVRLAPSFRTIISHTLATELLEAGWIGTGLSLSTRRRTVARGVFGEQRRPAGSYRKLLRSLPG